jgi:hypothetical protein
MTDAQPNTVYDPNTLFDEHGPIDPMFMGDAVQALMRAHPLDAPESEAARQRHQRSTLIGLAATHPRDAIEVMISVQALSAYQAACTCWRVGMNSRDPSKDRIRHISAAATAARTFDTMLRALERRQVKPLSVPVGRPEPKRWPADKITSTLDQLADRVQRSNEATVPERPQPPTPATQPETPEAPATEAMTPSPPALDPPAVWSQAEVAVADQMLEKERIDQENEGLDIPNTEGILPGGGMILTQDPTPQQKAYMGRRLGLMYRREYAENLRQGNKTLPKIRGIRPGDLIP